MLGIIQQTKEFSSHTIHQILSSKIEKKNTQEMSESGGFFQIFTHDYYEQTNGIQLEFFYKSPMQGILQKTEELRHKLHQIP